MQTYKVILHDEVSVEIEASGIDVAETGHLLFGDEDGKIIAAFSDWIGCIPMKPLLKELDTVTGEIIEVDESIPDEPEGRQ